MRTCIDYCETSNIDFMTTQHGARSPRQDQRAEEAEWESAGLTDREGRLQRPGFPAKWRVPEHVWLDQGDLRWDPRAPKKDITPPVDLLDVFVRLAESRDERILTFARTYGVVRLCKQHGLPISHRREVGGDLGDWQYPCDPLGGSKQPYTPSAWYSGFAAKCRAVLNIAQRLERGVAGRYEDWNVLDADYARSPLISVGLGWQVSEVPRATAKREDLVDEDRDYLRRILDSWLDMTDVRFHLVWADAPIPQFQVEVHSLFGALVTGLAMTLTRGGLATCSACGRAYQPTRRPAAGRRNYCQDESCQRARKTNATRASRARKHEKEKQQ
jgi:hypothetical protein